MRKAPWALVIMALTALLLTAAPVTAKGKPNEPPGKPTTTTTTEAPEAAPSCYQRVREMGATGWSYDPITEDDTQWNGTAYVQSGLPVCIDIDQPGHNGAVTWEVTWSGESARPIKGLKFVFELGVHGTTFAEHVTTSSTCDASNDCSWTVAIDPGGLDPLVLVVMPRAGDKWSTAPTFNVTPVGS